MLSMYVFRNAFFVYSTSESSVGESVVSGVCCSSSCSVTFIVYCMSSLTFSVSKFSAQVNKSMETGRIMN